MSTFYQWFSSIHFRSQCLFFERVVDFTISLYYNKYAVRHFDNFFTSKSVRKSFSIIKVFLKILQNSQKAIYDGFSFPMKLKVAG